MGDLTYELDSLCKKVMADKIVKRDQQDAAPWGGGRGGGLGAMGMGGMSLFGGNVY